MITIDKANIDDYSALMKMLGEAFIVSETGKETDFPALLPKLYESGVDTMQHHYILKDDGKIKANVAAIPLSLNVLGSKLKVAGIGMVSVSNDARKNGYMRLLMNQAIDDIKSSKYDFGVLGGHRQRYEYFGFTPSGVSMEFALEKHNLLHLFGVDKTTKYTFREIVSHDVALSKILRLYNKKSVHADRDSDNLLRVLKTWEAKPFAIYNKDELAGYLVLSKDGYSICEIELYDNDTLGEVLYDFYFSHTEKEKALKIVDVLPNETEKMTYLSKVCEYFHIETPCNVAIYNFLSTMQTFAKLKTSYTKVPDGSFVIEIKGVQKLKVICKDNVVSVIPTLDAPDISVDYLTAIQLIFSCISAQTSFGQELNPTARALFPLPLVYPHIDNV